MTFYSLTPYSYFLVGSLPFPSMNKNIHRNYFLQNFEKKAQISFFLQFRLLLKALIIVRYLWAVCTVLALFITDAFTEDLLWEGTAKYLQKNEPLSHIRFDIPTTATNKVIKGQKLEPSLSYSFLMNWIRKIWTNMHTTDQNCLYMYILVHNNYTRKSCGQSHKLHVEYRCSLTQNWTRKCTKGLC